MTHDGGVDDATENGRCLPKVNIVGYWCLMGQLSMYCYSLIYLQLGGKYINFKLFDMYD